MWADAQQSALYHVQLRALTIPELQEKAKITLVSATSIVEGRAHDVLLRDKR